MKRHTKRALTLILTVMVLAACLTACGGAPDSSSTPPTPSTTTSSQADTNNTTHTPTGTTTPVTNKGGAELLNKLKQIQPDWTRQQVYDLLGKPDRYGEASSVREVMYTIDDTTEAVVRFWDESTEIMLMDTVTHERTPLPK